jgi:hypothetical protein
MTRLLSRFFSYRQPKFVCAWASTFAGPLPLCPPPFVADLLAANFDVLVSSSLIGQKYRDGEHLRGRPSQTAAAGDAADSIVEHQKARHGPSCRWGADRWIERGLNKGRSNIIPTPGDAPFCQELPRMDS